LIRDFAFIMPIRESVDPAHRWPFPSSTNYRRNGLRLSAAGYYRSFLIVPCWHTPPLWKTGTVWTGARSTIGGPLWAQYAYGSSVASRNQHAERRGRQEDGEQGGHEGHPQRSRRSGRFRLFTSLSKAGIGCPPGAWRCRWSWKPPRRRSARAQPSTAGWRR
jgi:hypothetical protein